MAKRLAKKTQFKVDLLTTYQKVFDSEDGKLILHDMMKANGMFDTTFDENPYRTAFQEGRRSVITNLIMLLGKDANEMYKQFKEQEEIQNLY